MIGDLPPRQPEVFEATPTPWMLWPVHRLEFYFVLFWVLVMVMLIGAVALHRHDVVVLSTLTTQRDDLANQVSTLKDRVITDEFDISELSIRRAELQAKVDILTDDVGELERRPQLTLSDKDLNIGVTKLKSAGWKPALTPEK